MDVTITCPCPGTPHPDGDTVTLRERLDFRGALAVRNNIGIARAEAGEDLDTADVLAVLSEGYLLHGITAWTLVGDDGKPVGVSRAAIRERILERTDLAYLLADAADDLYAEQVVLPLVARASMSSPPTPTGPSTSPKRPSSSTRRTPSSPSSIASIPTAGTATTSSPPDGGSSSSPSSESAA